MACNLRPFRDYDEHDVVNLFALQERVSYPLTKGHFVCFGVANEGWKNTDELARLGAVGGTYTNTVSERYGVNGRLYVASGTSTDVLGMTLYDVKETDENGEKFIFNPRKAAENDIVVSGQAVPVATRGIFLYSGSVLVSANAKGGATLYVDNNGELTDSNSGGDIVGTTLGGLDANNHQLVRINL